MTTPVRPINSLQDAQSAQDQEWADYLDVHKRIMADLMAQSAALAQQIGLHPPNALQAAATQPGVMQQSVPYAGHEGDAAAGAAQFERAKQDLIDRASIWGIQNPERYTPQQLQQILDQKRAGLKPAAETTPETVTQAIQGSITEAASASLGVLGHVLGNVDQGLGQVPFVGKMLTDMLNTERARNWVYHWSSVADEASKIIVATQPQQDQSAARFLTGAGQMAGYILPAVAAWEGLGAFGASLPAMPWLGRIGASPMARAAVRGALASMLTQDPDAPPSEQALNVGLGAILGASSMWGRIGLGIAGGTLGAGFGATQGATPEERQQNTKYYGLGGAVLGFLAPTAGQIFTKARTSFKSPMDAGMGDPLPNPGESWADVVSIEGPPAIGPGGGGGQPTLPPGHPAGPPQVSANPPIGPLGMRPEAATSLPIAEAPPRQLGPGGEVQTVSPQQAQIGPPQVAGYLPARATTPMYVGQNEPTSTEIAEGLDHLYQVRDNPVYAAEHGWQPSFDNELRPTLIHRSLTSGLNPQAGEINYEIDAAEHAYQAAVYNEQKAAAEASRPASRITTGPAHLIGSRVADASGNPLRVYHGTKQAFDQFDLSFDSGGNLYAKGLYHTEDPEVASTPGYAGQLRTAWTGLDQAYQHIVANHPASGMPELRDHMQADLSSLLGDLGESQATDDAIVGIVKERYGYDLTPHGQSVYKPNIRPAFLDIKNPWDMDKVFSNEELDQIIRKLDEAYPEYDWTSARSALVSSEDPRVQAVFQHFDNNGENVWHILSNVETYANHQGPQHDASWWQYPDVNAGAGLGPAKIGEDGLNAALRTIGYDGITHIGGQLTGGKTHRVWIAWDPSQVHSPWVSKPLTTEAAIESANAISKQATVVEAATAGDAASKVQTTDADVVTAAKLSNPGGITIIRNISHPLDILYDHPDVQFASRSDRLDALVGRVTQEQRTQYEQFGAFEGQRVTVHGQEGTLVALGHRPTVNLDDGSLLRFSWDDVMPSRYGQAPVEIPDLYNSFKADLLRYLNEESAQAGMAPVESIWDPRATDSMQTHLIDYLKRRGIENPAVIQVIDGDINSRWAEEARDLDPEVRDFQAQQQDQWATSENERVSSDEPLPVSMEEKAQSKGFIWVTDPGSGGGMMKDILNPEGGLEIPMASEEAAIEFLRHVDRVPPDLNPATPVPAEAGMTAVADGTLEPRLPMEEHADILADGMYEWLGGAGGGGEPPSGGPPTGGTMGPDEWARLSGDAETLGDQFARLRKDDPRKLDALREAFKSNVFRYTRYLMQKAEDALTQAGVDLGRAWLHYENLETARSQSDVASLPWIQEYSDIMAGFRRKILRSGDVMRIHAIEDPHARAAEWYRLGDKYGYSNAQVRGFIDNEAKLDDFWYRFHLSRTGSELYASRADREMLRYMDTVRGRHAAGDESGVYSSDGILSDPSKFFADFAEHGNWQFRVNDAREIGQQIIRGAMFEQYQRGPWEELTQAWGDPRVPREFQDLMLGHANLMRYGYNAEGDLLVNGIQKLVSTIVPITRREAAQLLQVPINFMYRSMLGGKASIFFRDATQPLLALAKVRAPTLGGVYMDVLRGEGENSFGAMFQRGVDGGWITPEAPPIEGVGAFEDQGVRSDELAALSPSALGRREAVADRLDAVEDIPTWLKQLERRTNTLNLYGKEQQVNRLIVGEAAYRQATAGLAEYRRLELEAALSKDPSRAMSYQDLADKTFFSSFSRPIQRAIKEQVDAGNDQEAANIFARQVAKWSQFVYGRREQPQIVRSQFGRLMYTFGNFTGQFAEAVGSMLTSGSENPAARAAQIARGAMVIGGVTYALKKLENETGWGFSKWTWPNAFKFTGSPLAQAGADVYEALGGAIAASEGRSLSGAQQGALSDLQTGHPFLNAAADLFPYTGYLRTGTELARAQQGSNPLEQSARYLVTGDRGSQGLLFPPNFLDQQRDEMLERIRQADSLRHQGPGGGAQQ